MQRTIVTDVCVGLLVLSERNIAESYATIFFLSLCFYTFFKSVIVISVTSGARTIQHQLMNFNHIINGTPFEVIRTQLFIPYIKAPALGAKV